MLLWFRAAVALEFGVLALTLVLVLGKLQGVLPWSWWWVLAPVWVELIVSVLVIGVVVCRRLALQRHLDARGEW